MTLSVRLSRSGVEDAADADDDVELCQILKYSSCSSVKSNLAFYCSTTYCICKLGQCVTT